MLIRFTEKSTLWWSLERQEQWVKGTASVAQVPLACSPLPYQEEVHENHQLACGWDGGPWCHWDLAKGQGFRAGSWSSEALGAIFNLAAHSCGWAGDADGAGNFFPLPVVLGGGQGDGWPANESSLAVGQGRADCQCHSVRGWGCSSGLDSVPPKSVSIWNLTLWPYLEIGSLLM